MTGKRVILTPAQWASIRQTWEYDPDEPNLVEAASRVAAKLGCESPSKQALSKRYNQDKNLGHEWQRRGSLTGINQAAQRKADSLVDADGTPKPPPGPRPTPGVDNPAERAVIIQQAREESEDKRAEVLARHRQEWKQVATLRQEALRDRAGNPGQSFERAKLAKITAEMTSIQQAGERKAWGLDDISIPDLSKKSDAELRAILEGKSLG
jgi:hypothetical protein